MITIADSGGYNIYSIQVALDRLGKKSQLTSDPKAIAQATHLIIPGVGHAGAAIDKIRKGEFEKSILDRTKPTLGICVGMQLLFSESEESEKRLLNLIPGRVKKLNAPGLSVPHMGWNSLEILSPQCPLLNGLKGGEYVYYVHSFAAPIGAGTMASTNYAEDFSAVVQRDLFFGVQFHPEKSSRVGELILRNFIEL